MYFHLRIKPQWISSTLGPPRAIMASWRNLLFSILLAGVLAFPRLLKPILSILTWRRGMAQSQRMEPIQCFDWKEVDPARTSDSSMLRNRSERRRLR